MTEIGSVKRENLNGNFSPTNPIFGEYRGINCDVEFKMEIDTEDDETSARKFRDFAAECRRLARTASETDRVVLIEIAEAWMVCAEQVERNA
ncbi:MAG TPA: hypothetical protein VGH47_01500, partial [Xanthobacteraceae bacterium]